MKSMLLILSMLGAKAPFVTPESKISLSQLVEFEALSNKPLHMGAARLTNQQENALHQKITDWDIDRLDIHRLRQSFEFRSRKKAIAFKQALHETLDPDFSDNVNIFFVDKSVIIELYTPEVMGLTENDFILAARISTLKFVHFSNA